MEGYNLVMKHAAVVQSAVSLNVTLTCEAHRRIAKEAVISIHSLIDVPCRYQHLRLRLSNP